MLRSGNSGEVGQHYAMTMCSEKKKKNPTIYNLKIFCDNFDFCLMSYMHFVHTSRPTPLASPGHQQPLKVLWNINKLKQPHKIMECNYVSMSNFNKLPLCHQKKPGGGGRGDPHYDYKTVKRLILIMGIHTWKDRPYTGSWWRFKNTCKLFKSKSSYIFISVYGYFSVWVKYFARNFKLPLKFHTK